MPSANDDLRAMEDIRQLKARYFRFMDTKDWDGMATIFCRDAVFDLRAGLHIDPEEGDPDHVYEGRDTIVRFLSESLADKVSVHHGHCHEVWIDKPDEARGVIAMFDVITQRETGRVILEGYGHYHETYRRVDGAWRIWRSRLSRLKVVTDFGYFGQPAA